LQDTDKCGLPQSCGEVSRSVFLISQSRRDAKFLFHADFKKI